MGKFVVNVLEFEGEIVLVLLETPEKPYGLLPYKHFIIKIFHDLHKKSVCIEY